VTDKRLLHKLGVRLDDEGEIACQASDEAHMVCDYLLEQIEAAVPMYEKAHAEGDTIGMTMIALQQDVLMRAAKAIHAGAHLD